MKRKKVVAILCIVVFSSCAVIKSLEPIHVKNDGIARASILGIEGEALLDTGSEVEDVIKAVNSVKAIRGKKNLYEEIGGDTPDINISFWNSEDEILHSVSFYGSIIRHDDTYYKIIAPEIQYSKIRKLCSKYGSSPGMESQNENKEGSDGRIREMLILIVSVMFILICLRVIMKKLNGRSK